jgi:hypothetical protein
MMVTTELVTKLIYATQLKRGKMGAGIYAFFHCENECPTASICNCMQI